MPITPKDAPDVLPGHAREIFAAAFNSAYDDTCETRNDRDECSSKIAWGAVKRSYKKSGDKWVPKAALADVTLTITKASLLKSGVMRWQATCSDTNKDQTGERTSKGLFEDWIARSQGTDGPDWLPPARVPFLGLSHYPSLEGKGEAGATQKMYIDGKCFKASGEFDRDNPLGAALFEAVRKELGLIKMGHSIEQPIRISAAWWDIEHSHGNFVFSRRSATDRCPMCADGTGDKQYLKGQLDHFAATRVPINPRTALGLEEKSMATRKDDAASIVGEELAEELEETAQEIVGKSEAEQEPVLVIKADEEETETEKAETGTEPDPLTQLQERVAALEGRLPPEGVKTVTEEVKEEAVEETPAPEQSEANDPAAVLGTAVKAALEDESLSREGRLDSIQGALNTYAEAVKAQLDVVAPPAPGEEMVAAIERSLGTFAEKLELIIAKLDQKASVSAAPPAVPTQRSYVPTGPVQPQAEKPLPTSPYTGNPSNLRALIERSVGMHQ